MQASVPIGGATKLLQDAANVRWSAADLLFWLNEGQRQIVQVRPDAKTSRALITLAAGVDQTIPAGGLRLLKITRNETGRAITLVSEEQLTDLDPSWPAAGEKPLVKHYIHDPLEPKAFQVYPPAQAGIKVQGVWSVSPTACADANAAIDIDDVYEPVLVDYILFRAYSRDSADAAKMALAGFHRDNFMMALGGKKGADQAADPRASQPNKISPNQR